MKVVGVDGAAARSSSIDTGDPMTGEGFEAGLEAFAVQCAGCLVAVVAVIVLISAAISSGAAAARRERWERARLEYERRRSGG
jgi:hypothetical protein